MLTRNSLQEGTDATSADSGDAIDILTQDHRTVDALLEEYESTKDDADDEEKESRVATLCLELTLHATVEEEIFYPAARDALDRDQASLLDEAEVEHASVRELITQLSEMRPGEPLYDAKVKVLGEYVKHHVQEEEGELFPALRSAGLDLEALGGEIASRKESLRAELEAEATM